MSFYELERAAQVLPHDASIHLHDGWVSFRRPGYPSVFYTARAGSIRELAYRAEEEWQRYRERVEQRVAAPAKSAHVGLSARERVEQRCLEQAEADRKLFVSVATIFDRYLVMAGAGELALIRDDVPETLRPTLEWLESEAKKRGSKPWREYAEGWAEPFNPDSDPEGWEHE